MKSKIIAFMATLCIGAVAASITTTESTPNIESDFSIIFQPNHIFAEGFEKLNQMRINKQLCDIELQFQNSTILAHANVLAATIPYFNSILITDVDTERNISAALQHLEASAVENMVQFAYTGSLEINERNVDAFMKAAEFFQIHIDNHVTVSTRITTGNVLSLHRIAKTEYFEDLRNKTRRFINSHFQEAAMSDGFLAQNLTELIDIISANDLQVSSEEIIYDAVINWVKYDEAKRSAFLPQILHYVRLPFINTQYLRTELTTELYKNSFESRELIYQSILYRLMPNRKHSIPESWTRRSHTPSALIHIFDQETKSTFNINPYDKSIRNVIVKNDRNDFYSITTYDGLVYVFGGGYNAPVTKVESFNPTTAVWTTKESFSVPRHMSSAIELNNTIYLSGGNGKDGRLKSVESYNTLTAEWSIVASMLVARSSHQMVILDNHVFAIGGSQVSSVEKYDPLTNTWTLVATQMNRARAGFGAVVFNGQIYVCGGTDGLGNYWQSAEVFNPVQEQWTYIASMHMPRFGVGLVGFNSKLWAIGGLDTHDDKYFIEEYDSEVNTWKEVVFETSFKQYNEIHAVTL